MDGLITDEQKDHLLANLPDLLQNTDVDIVLLSHLRQLGTISHHDQIQLEITQNEYERAAKLYNLVEKRINGYESLAFVLQKTGQSVAFKILEEKLTQPENKAESDTPPHQQNLKNSFPNGRAPVSVHLRKVTHYLLWGGLIWTSISVFFRKMKLFLIIFIIGILAMIIAVVRLYTLDQIETFQFNPHPTSMHVRF